MFPRYLRSGEASAKPSAEAQRGCASTPAEGSGKGGQSVAGQSHAASSKASGHRSQQSGGGKSAADKSTTSTNRSNKSNRRDMEAVRKARLLAARSVRPFGSRFLSCLLCPAGEDRPQD